MTAPAERDPRSEPELDVRTLLEPGRYAHPVRGTPQLLETHISWVILTGEYAYKIKKPVAPGFLDFSTLERRRFYCHQELRLNRRLAPEIYLDVVPVTGTREDPRVGGDGPVVDYAVRMRQFPQEALLDRMLERGALGAATLEALAERVAAFHEEVQRAPPDSPLGAPEAVHRPVDDNFELLLAEEEDRETRARLGALREAAARLWRARRAAFEARRREGFVRECHGDLHLGNIALVDHRLVIFDCIEFSETLRWIDVMSEVALLLADLEHRGQAQLGWRFLNRYLEHTGDYAGLAVLRYYQGYRAMVRAKVAQMRRAQDDVEPDEAARLARELTRYLDLAERYTAPPAPALVITRGLSGSGKTTVARALAERLGAVHLRSDVERKRLFGLAPGARSDSPPGGGIYTADATAQTYHRLAALAGTVLETGEPVIVDATFLERGERDRCRRLARERGVPFAVLALHADEATLRARVARRAGEGRDASEANRAVLERQLRSGDALAADEREQALVVDTSGSVDADALAGELRRRLGL